MLSMRMQIGILNREYFNSEGQSYIMQIGKSLMPIKRCNDHHHLNETTFFTI